MEDYKDFAPPVHDITPEDNERLRAELAEDEANFKLHQEERRTQVSMEFAGVTPEEWENMAPVFKGWYTERAISEYNRQIDENRLELIYL